MTLLDEFIGSQGEEDAFSACRSAVREYFGITKGVGQIDLEKLAIRHNIIVRKCHNTAFEGMIERGIDGRATIVIRNGLNRRRERFTMAHELGHWLLQEKMIGPTKGRLFRGLSRNTGEMGEEEYLASLLAAEILMPVDSLIEVYDPQLKIRSLQAICRKFGVSRTAAVRRIADVCNCNLILIQIVPFLFHELESAAEIDDAIFVSGRRRTLFARERTRIVGRFPFKDLIDSSCREIKLKTPKGDIVETFELDYRPAPIPHVFALTCGQLWH